MLLFLESEFQAAASEQPARAPFVSRMHMKKEGREDGSRRLAHHPLPDSTVSALRTWDHSKQPHTSAGGIFLLQRCNLITNPRLTRSVLWKRAGSS